MNIIDKQVEFLKGLKKEGKRVLNEHRSIIMNQLRSWNYDALLCKTITYVEFREIGDRISNDFSWENLTGVKQLSIFEDIPDYNTSLCQE